MNRPYIVRCLDAKYDGDNGMLVLNCLFEEQQMRRIVVLSREDFHYKGNEVPDIEMYKTSTLFRGKRFKLVVDDDPDLNKIDPEMQKQYAAMFNKQITEELEKVQEGLGDEEKQIQRKLGKLVKKDALSLLTDEQSIQAKLGGAIE